jgi:hypothetical protein
MNKIWKSLLIIVLAAISTGSYNVLAQRTPSRANDRQITSLLTLIERDSDTFRQSMTAALDSSSWNGTRTEDEIQSYVDDFENATDQLKRNYESRASVEIDVEQVLNRASNINNFLKQYRFSSLVTTDWNRLRSDLTTLARYYNINYNWNQTSNNASYGNRYPNNSSNNLARLTGTYRLDTTRSSDIDAEIDKISQDLNSNQRERVRRVAARRLESPNEIAIERNNRSVTIASTKSPRITFEADGQTRSEQMPNGRTMSVNTTFYGEQLVINYTGDRMNDFYVAFNPVQNGNDLRVTRRVYLEGVNRQLTVNSYYTRASDVAQLDTVFRGNTNTAVYNDYPNNNSTASNAGFVIPNGTRLTAILQTDLDTRQAQEGDRFTMRISAPSEYEGAIIEGRVGRSNRSGRVSGRAELALDFETIRLRDNRSYSFEGFIDQVRTANNEDVRIDNEGAVREDNSQTKRTATRAGVGAALGAIIGAIAGGGQGAAVGAAVGAGAGAGSVILQGRDDLNLKSGTEVSITASSPRGQATIR